MSKEQDLWAILDGKSKDNCEILWNPLYIAYITNVTGQTSPDIHDLEIALPTCFFICLSILNLITLLSYLVKHLNEFQDIQIMVLLRDRELF